MTTVPAPASPDAPTREDIIEYAGRAGLPVEEINIDELHDLVGFVFESVERFRQQSAALRQTLQ